MIGKRRALAVGISLAVALVMLFGLSSAGWASGTSTDTDTVCVNGYVINHRELAVDGEQLSLLVKAVGVRGEFSALVGSDGYFEFEELPVGDWNFRLQLPPGWEGIVPSAERGGLAETGLTPLEASESCYSIVFKIRRVFDIVVIKWEELLDGTVRGGEGWEITATPINDPYVKPQTDTTDEEGYTGFTLTAGKWIIAETVKAGWRPLTPPRVTIELDQYDTNTGAMPAVVFKNLEPPCYSKIIVEKHGYGTDAEGNQKPLGPLAGWKITLSRADGRMAPVNKLTDGSGRVTFTNLPPGVYIVRETLQPGWEAMSDNPQTVIIMNCTSLLEPLRFDNQETKGKMTIHGKKLFRAWTPPYKGEIVGLSGWKITATLVGTDVSVDVQTNALGEYVFTEEQLKEAGMAFAGASIDVCEEDRDNWIHVTPACVRVTFPYPLPSDYEGAEVNFTNVQDPPLVSVGAASWGCRATHSVAYGQTLADIAVTYGTSVGVLVRANSIRNADLIFAGQQLCIP